MEQGIDIKAWIAALRRRWIVILLPVILLTPLGVGVAYILPSVYQATARVIVESQQIPSDLARSTVTVDVAERIALIEQRLMTRQNLLDIAARFSITKDKAPMSPTAIVDMMRAATSIDGLRLTGSRGPVTGINISFTADRGDLAAQVANEFLSLLLAQNIRQRQTRALETSDYFRQETARLSDELSSLEARITRFKIDNGSALPDSLPFRREELSRLQQQLFDREVRQLELQEQKKAILDAMERGEFDIVGRKPTPEEEELARLRTTLVQRRSTYAQSHPIVRSLEARIAVLENRIGEQTATDAATAGGSGPPSNVTEQVNKMLEALDKQMSRLETRHAEEEVRVKALQASIEKTPGVELELNRLERQLSTLQTQYRETVLKLAQAETGERLEVNQQAERFEVIERAEAPPRPTSPNRPVIAAAGFVGSLGVGFGLALLLELLNRSVRTAADLERRLDLRPVVTIPYIRTAREVWRRKWTVRAALILFVVVTPAALYLVDQYYQPLPLLAQRLMGMTGLDSVIAMIENRMNR
jgi:polysaccharide chain length determinant protein (PEP-CTERM system associated)